MTGTHQITAGVLTSADQITRGLLVGPRHPHRRGISPSRSNLANRLGVPPVGLDPIGSRPDLRRRRHNAADPRLSARARKPIPGRPRLRTRPEPAPAASSTRPLSPQTQAAPWSDRTHHFPDRSRPRPPTSRAHASPTQLPSFITRASRNCSLPPGPSRRQPAPNLRARRRAYGLAATAVPARERHVERSPRDFPSRTRGVSRRGWLPVRAMCVIWGILGYLLIRVAVRELTPAVLVFGRTALAALILLPDRRVAGRARGAFGPTGGRCSRSRRSRSASPWVLLANRRGAPHELADGVAPRRGAARSAPRSPRVTGDDDRLGAIGAVSADCCSGSLPASRRIVGLRRGRTTSAARAPWRSGASPSVTRSG